VNENGQVLLITSHKARLQHEKSPQSAHNKAPLILVLNEFAGQPRTNLIPPKQHDERVRKATTTRRMCMTARCLKNYSMRKTKPCLPIQPIIFGISDENLNRVHEYIENKARSGHIKSSSGVETRAGTARFIRDSEYRGNLEKARGRAGRLGGKRAVAIRETDY